MTTSTTIAASAALLQSEIQVATDRTGKDLSGLTAQMQTTHASLQAQAADEARRAATGVGLNTAAVEARKAKINAQAAVDAMQSLEIALGGLTTMSGIAARALSVAREAAEALHDLEQRNVKEAARLKAADEARATSQLAAQRRGPSGAAGGR
ncbi:secreted protein [sediment metagenome]|uniref:Secreted protein n=1 Tax=sediment metagenome TaxID=749907 RepID=D9PKE0_9ZZZZ